MSYYRTRLDHVTYYNGFMDINRKFTMMFTVGNGSMADAPRLKGWILWQSPLKGDAHDFAKWYPNKQEAETARRVMA
jgi:hypothetical protein